MAQGPASDLLAPLALRYATTSARLVRRAVPAGVEVILRLRSRVYFATMRALVAKALADGGARHWREEANESAEQALSAIERSRRVLDRWPDQGRESRELVGVLDAIADGLRAEFPSVARRPLPPVPAQHHRKQSPKSGRP